MSAGEISHRQILNTHLEQTFPLTIAMFLYEFDYNLKDR